MKTWTTTRWELEHRSVQGGIETLRLKYHQDLNFKMKCDFLSCFLPDFGTVIDNWTINFSNRMIGKQRETVELDRKGEKKYGGSGGESIQLVGDG